MDFYFKPQPGAFRDNVLRVQPDILPPGSVRLEAVWINGEHYADFDAEAMTINLPTQPAAVSTLHPLQQRPAWAGNPHLLPTTTQDELRIKVRLVPAGLTYDMALYMQDGTADLFLEGSLDDSAALAFTMQLDKVAAARPKRFVLHLEDLQTMSKECARTLAFVSKRMAIDVDIYVVGASQGVTDTLQSIGFLEEATAVANASQIDNAQSLVVPSV
jgi:anti-anti-sigma regulatory factor